jgi:hypothetical protein
MTWTLKGMKVGFDKILRSLVTTMDIRIARTLSGVAMYWMSRIVKAHMIAKLGQSTW